LRVCLVCEGGKKKNSKQKGFDRSMPREKKRGKTDGKKEKRKTRPPSILNFRRGGKEEYTRLSCRGKHKKKKIFEEKRERVPTAESFAWGEKKGEAIPRCQGGGGTSKKEGGGGAAFPKKKGEKITMGRFVLGGEKGKGADRKEGG